MSEKILVRNSEEQKEDSGRRKEAAVSLKQALQNMRYAMHDIKNSLSPDETLQKYMDENKGRVHDIDLRAFALLNLGAIPNAKGETGDQAVAKFLNQKPAEILSGIDEKIAELEEMWPGI